MSASELGANLAFWVGGPLCAHLLVSRSGWPWLQAAGAGLAGGVVLALITSALIGLLAPRGR